MRAAARAVLPDLVPRLRRFKELQIEDTTAAQLLRIAPATIDRRLKTDRAKLDPRGRTHTKPGTLLKDSIPMRTWAEWNDAVPGFVEIDLVGHEGGNSRGEFCFTLDITDIATGWTETRSVRNKAQKWVFAAIKDATAAFPFPILGIDSDNGSEFINWELLTWCEQENLTFTRSRSGNKNDGAHVEQKNSAHRAPDRRIPPLRHRRRAGTVEPDLGAPAAADEIFRAAAEAPGEDPDRSEDQQDLRPAATPFQRVLADTGTVSRDVKPRLPRENKPLNPAAIQRRIQALSAELLTLTTSKARPKTKATVAAPTTRASSDEATNQTSRAS